MSVQEDVVAAMGSMKPAGKMKDSDRVFFGEYGGVRIVAWSDGRVSLDSGVRKWFCTTGCEYQESLDTLLQIMAIARQVAWVASARTAAATNFEDTGAESTESTESS